MKETTSLKNKARKAAFGLAALGLLTFGAVKAGKSLNDKNRDKNQKTEQEPKKPTDFISMAMAEYYPELFIAVEELETYRSTPTKHTKESRYTYWNGLTWVYTVSKDGAITQHPCTGKYKSMVELMNRGQMEEQFRLHLQFDTFKSLKNAIKDKKNINHKQIVGLCMVGYQLPGKMAPIAEYLDKATNTQQIMDAFKYALPDNVLWREGTLKRRWWCGAYAAGLITSEDLLELKKDSFSKIALAKVATKVNKNKDGKVISVEHFKFDEETVHYALNIARTKGDKPIVKDVLNQTDGGRAAIKAVKTGIPIEFMSAKSNFDNAKYNIARATFATKDYNLAIEQFKELLAVNPNDALLLNDLAASYNNIGEHKAALECTNKIFKEIKDKSQYAAAYYNAGVAREELGEYESALANYQMAKEKGNKSQEVNDAIKRVQNILNRTGQKQAYNSATKKLAARMQLADKENSHTPNHVSYARQRELKRA